MKGAVRLSDNKILVDVNNLKKHFSKGKDMWGRDTSVLKAVDGVSFQIRQGETFGLVGESGSGKSTVGRCLLRLYDYTDGEVSFDGQPLSKLGEKQLKPFRRRIQSIFQDPYSSLNPSLSVLDLISEPMKIHGIHEGEERKEAVAALLEKVGLKREHLYRFPHEFSGGQRQRISIARALSVRPEFVVCDEPISALDVSVQAQVVNMLEDLQSEFGLTYLFVAHDLSMVRHISDRIGVMYGGRLVEVAESDELYENPIHPYTKALLSSILETDPRRANQRIILDGYSQEYGRAETSTLQEVSPGHYVAYDFTV
ncbi:peptide ABC transporter substrate-binding protein [Paenibacillus odorifer]|uniref:Peptide ABC transporter substrate-binding protein n=1 Tax=Paenibacillus odorifer TaxID=189426 RepID=A0ABX3GQL7_9BACL|nr:peptide ABC transporter substrate-binding protein [Paenibacillus odorifer]OMD56210.1 peptide ABC transporter substrate-binding protein [Paenibacillus odorifer]OMD69208.1 peptide ABC transporter substrate-binding protein [Paenibacillus odorifer]OMD92231.1 peptide ABC transporter substrate-binding protein [Paenibacillus odorifer]OME03059.1 peptide ABC transporter substrate-binding protein [Paenibacillus odorifer]